jgi:RNA polymerase sigma-70 factor (ECF subfamily)
MQLAPSIGGAVARATAHAEVRGPETGLTLLDQIDSQAVISYQPYWAVRAHFLRQLGRPQAAAEAYDLAIGLSDDPAVRTFLTARRNRLTPQ